MIDQPGAIPADTTRDAAARFEMVYRTIEVYRRHCLSKSLLQFEMFLLVAARTRITNGQIAAAVGCSEAAASVALGNLGQGSSKFGTEMGEPPDLIVRVDDPENARRKFIVLTENGNVLATQMRATLRLPLY